MKIKTEEKTFDEVCAIPKEKHVKPKKTNIFFRTLLKVVSQKEIKDINFKLNEINMEKLAKNEPCLYLMNHSSFTDLQIASHILYPKPFNIVCTADGFVGKKWLMRNLGCIPTKKFISDITLVRDMNYAVNKLKTSVLMYPEASYSFDGTETPLPDSLGKCIKTLGVPVVTVITHGAFLRDPLYNNLQKRKTDVSADMEYLLSKEEIREKSPEEINEIIKAEFSVNYFKEQTEKGVKVNEPFRADGLNRVLFQCPHCMTEGQTEGKGTTLKCHSCGAEYELTETGELKNLNGETIFNSVPTWYAFERENVRREIEEGKYGLNIPVKIMVQKDFKAIYDVGNGTLAHSRDGFVLEGCDGKLHFELKPQQSYSLYADYFWYEIGDVISIGDSNMIYYCFPLEKGDFVAKTRLATEEMFKMSR